MSDTPITPDLMQQLAAQLAAIQKPAAATGWSTPTVAVTPIGLAVPLKISTPRGELRVYLQLPAECAAGPDAILQTLQALDQQGLPLDVWQPKTNWGDSGSGWNRGGGYGNRGGWRR